MLNLMDTYVGGFPLLIIGMIELIVIVYIYGLSYESEQTNTYPMRLLRGKSCCLQYGSTTSFIQISISAAFPGKEKPVYIEPPR